MRADEVPPVRDDSARRPFAGQRGSIDLARARRDTPAAARVTHLKNAGAALPPVQVTDAMIDHLRLEARIGGHEAAAVATDQVERTYAAIAALYVRHSILDRLDPPFLDLHAATWTSAGTSQIRPDARRFESWETHCAGKIALGVAVDYAMSWGLHAIEDRVTDLAATLRDGLTSIDGVEVHDQGAQRCGIVTFTVDGYPADEVHQRLRENGINVSVSLIEHARLDLPDRGLPDLVRASVHYYNTHAELDRLLGALPEPRPGHGGATT